MSPSFSKLPILSLADQSRDREGADSPGQRRPQTKPLTDVRGSDFVARAESLPGALMSTPELRGL